VILVLILTAGIIATSIILALLYVWALNFVLRNR
jgi:hypothetical protein